MTEEEKVHDPKISMLERRGMMVVLSAPSGSGKTTISKALIKKDPHITFSVSTTARDKRPNEKEGIDYNFVSEDKFRELISDDKLLEYTIYNDHLYGTQKKEVEKTLEKGRDVIFDLDWQGLLKLKDIAEEDVISIFILPPSYAELYKRLVKRGRDSEEVINSRMAGLTKEISHYNKYQYILINEDIEESIERITSIVAAERLKRRRLTNLENFITQLDDEHEG